MNATVKNRATAVPSGAAASAPFTSLRRAMRSFFGLVAQTRTGMACAEDARRLFQLSDLELARRGLKRDEIVERAFRPFLRG